MTYAPDVGSNEFLPNQLLGGRYRVQSLLGRGGMGVVYKVEQIYLGIELALKTINQNSLSDISVRRFQAEARAVFALNHPNVISVHDFGLLDERTPFLAMEIVEGLTLASLLKRRVLTVNEAIPIFIQVCNGLAHAHEHGVVHRDIKPGNIMILDQLSTATEGSVKILDFGIAKMTAHEEGEMQSLTRTGEIFGSPLYMSPEQCNGGTIDHRSDIYSLGCVMFEALTGTTPFVGESTLSTMMMHQSATIPSLKEASLGSEFPKELEQIVQAMLAKNPNNRYQNLKEAAHDLAATERGEVLQHSPISSTKTGVASARGKANTISMRRKTLGALICGNIFFSAALGTTAMFLFIAAHKAANVAEVPFTSPFPKSNRKDDFLPQVKKHSNYFRDSYSATDESLAIFANYDGIQSLRLDGCSITDKGLSALKNTKIMQLTVNDCNITDVDNIASLEYLQSLDLHNTYIKDSALSKLAKMPMLRVLNLRKCKITEAGLKQLIPSTSLLDVQLTKEQFSQSAIDALAKSMPQCTFEGYTQVCEGQKLLNDNKVEPELFKRNADVVDFLEQIKPDLTLTADCLTTMSALRMQKKNYDEAEPLSGRARTMLERNGNKAELAGVLALCADLALAQHRYEDVDKYSDQCARISFDTMMHNEPALMVRIDQLTNHPYRTKLRDHSIKILQRAIELIKQQSPSALDSFLPIFTEKIGTFYFFEKKPAQALPYLKEHVALRRANKSKDVNAYAKSLIQLAHGTSDIKTQKELYVEGLGLLDGENHPAETNLREHYCDACASMVAAFDRENNPAEALRYAQRGLVVANEIDNDIYDRETLFHKQVIRHLMLMGREKEARQEAAAMHLPWSAELSK